MANTSQLSIPEPSRKEKALSSCLGNSSRSFRSNSRPAEYEAAVVNAAPNRM
jgi:hypothetical protein